MKKTFKYIGIVILSLFAFLIIFLISSALFPQYFPVAPDYLMFTVLFAPETEEEDVLSFGGTIDVDQENGVTENMVYEVIRASSKLYAYKIGADMWVNKTKLSNIPVFFGVYGEVLSPSGHPVRQPKQEDILAVINNIEIPAIDEKNRRVFNISYKGVKDETYDIEFSFKERILYLYWNEPVELKRTLYLHWLEQDEFEKLKAQKFQEFEKSEP